MITVLVSIIFTEVRSKTICIILLACMLLIKRDTKKNMVMHGGISNLFEGEYSWNSLIILGDDTLKAIAHKPTVKEVWATYLTCKKRL